MPGRLKGILRRRRRNAIDARQKGRMGMVLLLVSGAFVAIPIAVVSSNLTLGQSPLAAGASSPLPLQYGNLIRNPSFNQSFNNWAIAQASGTTTNAAVYTNSSAGEGGSYLESNVSTNSSGAGVEQVVSLSAAAGQSYTASILLRNVSPSQSDKLTVVVWAIGGASGNISNPTNLVLPASSGWLRESAQIDVPNSDTGVNELIVQVYEYSAGINTDLDGATLMDSGVVNPSFAQSLSGWTVVQSPGTTTNASIYNGSSAGEGGYFLESNVSTSNSGAGIEQIVSVNAQPGTSYTASILLRNVSTTQADNVAIALWAYNGSNGNVDNPTNLTLPASSGWIRASVEVDVPSTDTGVSQLILQVYEDSAGINTDFDGATLMAGSSSIRALPTGTGVYGSYGSEAIAQTAISDGWPIIADAGALGTSSSPYTGELFAAPDQNVATAIASSGGNVTWQSYWTVSGPTSTDTWYNDGYAAGQQAANTLDGYASSALPNFVVLDPEGDNNGQGQTPTTAGNWSSWLTGWSAGIVSINSGLTPAFYVDQSQYATYNLSTLNMPAFVAISPIAGNTPGVSGANINGFIGYYGGCPAAAYESTINGWGARYNTLQFADSSVDCGP